MAEITQSKEAETLFGKGSDVTEAAKEYLARPRPPAPLIPVYGPDSIPPTTRSPETSGAAPAPPVKVPCPEGAEVTDEQLFVRGVYRVAEVMNFGAAKYSPYGWQTVSRFRARYRSAAYRHLFAHLAGELRDAESGLYHLAHCATNLAFLCEAGCSREMVRHDLSPVPGEADGAKHDGGKTALHLLPMRAIEAAWSAKKWSVKSVLLAVGLGADVIALRAALVELGGLP